MKNKNALRITTLSILACVLHAVLLHTQFNHYAYTSALKVILFLAFPFLYFAVSKEERFKDLFSVKMERKNALRFFGLGVFVFAFIQLVFVPLRPLLDQATVVQGLGNIGITTSNYPFVFLYIVLINAALEEIFFRGFVFLTLYRMNLKRYAYIYSSMLFAFYHIFILNNWVAPMIFVLLIAGLVVAGLIFNELARRSDSVFGSLIVHISANMAINLIGVYYLYLHV